MAHHVIKINLVKSLVMEYENLMKAQRSKTSNAVDMQARANLALPSWQTRKSPKGNIKREDRGNLDNKD